MSIEKPFLGTTDNLSKAFPGVISFNLVVTQDPNGHYLNRPGQNISHFSLQNLTRFVRCLNPRCQQGGLDLQNIINFLESGDYEYWCQGHEGTPKGRRIGDSCDNRFKVSLQIKKNDMQ